MHKCKMIAIVYKYIYKYILLSIISRSNQIDNIWQYFQSWGLCIILSYIGARGTAYTYSISDICAVIAIFEVITYILT